MNKKFCTIAAGTVAGILALSGCNEDTYSYEVSGTVEARQIDYDCPGEDVAMGAVAFVEKGGKGPGGKSSKGKGEAKKGDSSDSDSSQNDGSDKALNLGSGSKPSKTPTASKTPTTAAKSTPTPTKSSRGVKLSKKPDKPEKVTSVPKKFTGKIPKGCETEYELYIRNGDGLFEQDVRREDYDNCAEGEKFAVCTED